MGILKRNYWYSDPIVVMRVSQRSPGFELVDIFARPSHPFGGSFCLSLAESDQS